MIVNVKYYGFVYNMTKVKEEKIQASKISDIVKYIKINYGKETVKEVNKSFILLNGENVALIKGYKTKLKEGDLVEIITVTAGG